MDVHTQTCIVCLWISVVPQTLFELHASFTKHTASIHPYSILPVVAFGSCWGFSPLVKILQHLLRPASTSDAHGMTADPLPECWKAAPIRQAQRKSESYNAVLQKGLWFHPAGIWTGEVEPQGFFMQTFHCVKKYKPGKSKICMRILGELQWKFGGKCQVRLWLDELLKEEAARTFAHT